MALGAIVGIPLALALLVLLVPTLVLNEPVLRKAADWVEGEMPGLRIRWDRIGIDWEVTRFLGRRIHVDFEGLHVELPDTGGTWQREGRVAFSYDLVRFVPRLREVGPVRMAGGRTAVRLPEAAREASPDQAKAGERPLLPGGLALVAVDLEDQSWTVELGDGVAAGVVSARSRETDHGLRVDIEGTHRVTAGAAAHSGRMRLSAVSENRSFAIPWADGEGVSWRLEAQATVDEGAFGAGRLHLEASAAGRVIDWEAGGQWAHEAGDAVLDASGRWGAGRVTGRVEAVASPTSAAGAAGRARVRLAECAFDWKALERALQSVRIDCPLRVDAGDDAGPGLPGGERPLVALNLAIQAELRRPFDASAPLDAQVEVRPQGVWLARADGFARASGTVIPARGLDQGEAVAVDIDLRFELPRFQELVQALAGTDWAIPAPLHSLEGPVKANVRGSGAAPGLELVASFATRLRSEHQRVLLDLDARMRPVGAWTDAGPRRVALTADLLLRDVLLRLPPLEGGVPAVLPDARIRPELEAPATAQPEGPLDYSVRVYTAPGEAMEISVPVSEEPIPVAADVVAGSGEATRGRIAIGRARIEAAGIEREIEGGELFLQLSEVTETAQGELTVDDAGRRIDMTLAEMSGLFSPLPEPKPPLALGQIVTALLVGRAVDVAVVARSTPGESPAVSGDAPTSLEFQYRY